MTRRRINVSPHLAGQENKLVDVYEKGDDPETAEPLIKGYEATEQVSKAGRNYNYPHDWAGPRTLRDEDVDVYLHVPDPD